MRQHHRLQRSDIIRHNPSGKTEVSSLIVETVEHPKRGMNAESRLRTPQKKHIIEDASRSRQPANMFLTKFKGAFG